MVENGLVTAIAPHRQDILKSNTRSMRIHRLLEGLEKWRLDGRQASLGVRRCSRYLAAKDSVRTPAFATRTVPTSQSRRRLRGRRATLAMQGQSLPAAAMENEKEVASTHSTPGIVPCNNPRPSELCSRDISRVTDRARWHQQRHVVSQIAPCCISTWQRRSHVLNQIASCCTSMRHLGLPGLRGRAAASPA